MPEAATARERQDLAKEPGKCMGETLTEPRAYRIRSGDAAAFAEPQQPTAVFRKSKPLERADNGQSPVRHVIYLKLPRARGRDALHRRGQP
ncbi:MAG: hypothetical protein PVH68_15955, partial [Armatimonadota bacterium]